MQCEARAKNIWRCTFGTLRNIFREATKQCADFGSFLPGEVGKGSVSLSHLVCILLLLHCVSFLLGC